ncbi:DUF349 domain-containing protein [bacterium]|nr:MAG: DUF349 domain-containing protein [bacterium]
MSLLEKLRSQPGWQHDDPMVRIEAVRGLPDDDDTDSVLSDVVRSDVDARVRRAAVERITDPNALISLAQDTDIDTETKRFVADGVREALIRMNTNDDWCAALGALTNERDLGVIARMAQTERIGLAALERVENDKTRGAVARKSRHMVVALEAIRRLEDLPELIAVATKADDKAVALAAYEQLTADANVDMATYDEIARSAKQKVIARRAREARQVGTNGGVVETEPSVADRASVLSEEINQLAQSISSLDEGRQQLNLLVERWSMLEGPIDEVIAQRFSSSRHAVEDRLLALDAESAEATRTADRRLIVESARSELCVRVEGLAGGDSLEELQAVLKDWASLEAPDHTDRELQLSLAGLSERFRVAVEAFEERHRIFLSTSDRLKDLEKIIIVMERIVSTGNLKTLDKEWSRLADRWHAAIASLDVKEPENATFSALLVRRQNVDKSCQGIREKAKRSQEEKARKNLSRVQKFVKSIDAAIKNEGLLLSDAERYLRQARQLVQSAPNLPTRLDRESLEKKLRENTTLLLGRVRELRDFSDWQRWANVGIQEELCGRMENLAVPAKNTAPPDEATVAKTFRELMNQWRAAADVPRDKGQALWQRFKKAHDLVYPRCNAFFVAQKAERKKNRDQRLALVKEAETLRESTDWIKTAARLTVLQAEWKKVGPAERKAQKALWMRFSSACNKFFECRKADLAARKRQWAENLKLKDALCVQAEEQRTRDDLAASVEETKRLQVEWKKIGPVRRTKSEAIWGRFRAACDGVFERVKEGQREAAVEKITARENLCVELESLLSVEEVEQGGVAARVRELQGRWRQAGDVPSDVRRQLSTRFGQAITRLVEAFPEQFHGTDLDPARKLKQLLKLCERAETLVPTEVLDEAGASPAEILAKKWRDQLAANTMGERVDEHARRRGAIEEIKRLQSDRRRLGSLTGSEASALQSRFQKACDRAYQKNQVNASTV